VEGDVAHDPDRNAVQAHHGPLLEPAHRGEEHDDLLLPAQPEAPRLEGRPEDEHQRDHDEDPDLEAHEWNLPGSLHGVPPDQGGACAGGAAAAAFGTCAEAVATALRKGARNWRMNGELVRSRSRAGPSKTTRPSLSIVIRFPTLNASAMSWVTMMEVLPMVSRSRTIRSVIRSAL